MYKQKSFRSKKMSKMREVDTVELKNEELRFEKILNQFIPFEIKSPIGEFLKAFNKEKLRIETRSDQEKATRLFMLMMNMEEISGDSPTNQKKIRNILEIFKGQNISHHLKDINRQDQRTAHLRNKNSFRFPHGQVYLHKKGKKFGKNVLREAYFFTKKFGQIKNGNRRNIFKPQKFSDQYVYLEQKSYVDGVVKGEAEKKKKKIPFIKILKWSKSAKISKCKYRVRFKERKNKGRQRAMYFVDTKVAKGIMSNAIVQRIQETQPQRLKTINDNINIWKIKQSEYFYNHFLKKLFENGPLNVKKIRYFNQVLVEGTQEYLQENDPVYLQQMQRADHEQVNYREQESFDKPQEKEQIIFKKSMEQQVIVKESSKKIIVTEQTNYNKIKIQETQDQPTKTQNIIFSGSNRSKQPNMGLIHTYDFSDNSHLKINQSKEEFSAKRTPNELDFATIINQDNLYHMNHEEVLAYKQKLKNVSPFENIQKQLPINQAFMQELVDNFTLQQRRPNFNNNSTLNYYNFLSRHNKIILNFNKIIVDNLFMTEECFMDKKEIDKMVFELICEVNRGKDVKKSMTFVEEVTEEYLAMDIDCSMEMNIKVLEDVKLTLRNKITGDIIFEDYLNLLNLLDTLQLESILNYGFQFSYKGQEFQGLISFLLIFLPKNLETSHLILNKILIETNFNQFGNLLNEIHSYIDYQDYFFSKKYKQIFDQAEKDDFYYFFNNYRSRETYTSMHQENMLFNSFKPSNFQETAKCLKSIAESKLSDDYLFKQTPQLIDSKELKHNHNFYDMIIKISNLLSIFSRNLFSQIMREFRNKKFFNFKVDFNKIGFNPTKIDMIKKDVEIVFQEMNHLTIIEKTQALNLIYKVYLMLENNTLNSQYLPVDFSHHYIPMIIKISQVNSPYLLEEHVLSIAVNQILSQENMRNYSKINTMIHINNAMIFMKVFFKKKYPREFTLIMDFMLSLDSIFFQAVKNSFADILDSINFNVYCDFKNFMYFVMISQINHNQMLYWLKEMEISFHVFIDVLYFVDSIVDNIDNMKDLDPSDFSESIRQSLKNNQRFFIRAFRDILDNMNFLYSNKLFKDEIQEIKESFQNRIQQRNYHLKKITANIRYLKTSPKHLKEVIKSKIAENDHFNQRIKALLQNKKNFENEDDDDDNDEIFASVIDEDIYFEIFENLNQSQLSMMNQISQKKKQENYQNLLNQLNNFDNELIKDNLISQIQDLNIILTFDKEQFVQMITSLFMVSKNVVQEIYFDMCVLNESENISWIKFLIILIMTFTEDKYVQVDLLDYLINSLSKIIFKNSRDHFDEMVAFVMNEIYDLTPVSFHLQFEKNLVQCLEGTRQCHIERARIIIPLNEIDITSLCKKHFCAQTFISKIPSIHFNRKFCKEIEQIFMKLFEDNKIDTEIQRFEIFLNIFDQGNQKTSNIPFRVTFSPEIQIISKFTHPIFFNSTFNNNNLINPNHLKNLFFNSPICFITELKDQKSPLLFMTQKFIFEFYQEKQRFYRVQAQFVPIDYRQVTSVLPWQFKTKKSKNLLKFYQNSIELSIPYSYFFFTLDQFYQVLCSMIVETLNEEDIFKFIQLNSHKKKLKTIKKKKEIQGNSHFFELREYNEIKLNGTFQINIHF